jgi:hypothetical protein
VRDGVGMGLVIAIAVRRLGDEQIDRRQDLRIPDDGGSGPAEVTGEPEAPALALDQHQRRAQDVPGVEERHGHAPGPERLPVAYRVHQRDRALRLSTAVERPRLGESLPPPQPVDNGDILPLHPGAVAQHQRREIARGRRAENRPPEPLGHERRQVAAVVEVGMGQDYGRDVGRLDGKALIPLERVSPSALKQPAVEEDAGSV